MIFNQYTVGDLPKSKQLSKTRSILGQLYTASVLAVSMLSAVHAQAATQAPSNDAASHVNRQDLQISIAQDKRPPASKAGVDSDGDGLIDSDEITLGTNPLDVDSDCDNIDDGVEVGGNVLAPIDSDNDGLIDALESRYLDSDGDGIKDDLDPSSGWQATCGRFTPFAVVNDQSTATRLELKITAGVAITSVRIESLSNTPTQNVFVDAVPVANLGGIELFDDGSNGDQVANDGTYSRGGITSNAALFSGLVGDLVFEQVTVTDANGTRTEILGAQVNSIFGDISLGVIAPENLAATQSLTPKMVVGPNLVNLIDPMMSLQVRRQLALNINTLQTVSQAFYQQFEDDFDFLMLFSDRSHINGAFGVNVSVSNDVQGIGLQVFDNAGFWGSAGRLKSVVVRNLGASGPSLHEIAHNWGAFLDTSLGFQACASAHWGAIGTGKGQLGGFDSSTLIDEGGGSYSVESFGTIANGGDGPLYSWIELYVMGLADDTEAPDFKVPVGIDCGSLADAGNGRMMFNASSIVDRSMADVINAEGARVPAAASSQKDFTTAYVLVSQQAMTAAEMGYIQSQAIVFAAPTATGFLQSFESATRGRGTMDTNLPATDRLFMDGFESLPTSVR